MWVQLSEAAEKPTPSNGVCLYIVEELLHRFKEVLEEPVWADVQRIGGNYPPILVRFIVYPTMLDTEAMSDPISKMLPKDLFLVP
jgi:hypothetical protein